MQYQNSQYAIQMDTAPPHKKKKKKNLAAILRFFPS